MSTTDPPAPTKSSASATASAPALPRLQTTTSHDTANDMGQTTAPQLYSMCDATRGVATFIYYSTIQKRNKTKTGWVSRTLGITTRGEIWQLEERAREALRKAETTTTNSPDTVPGVMTIHDTALPNAAKLSATGQAGIDAAAPIFSQHTTPTTHLTLLRIPSVDLLDSRLLLALFSTTPRRRVCVKMIDTFMTSEFRILADHRLLKLKAESMDSKAKWLEALQICLYIQNELRALPSYGGGRQDGHGAKPKSDSELIVEAKHCDDDDDDDAPLDAQQLHAKELRKQASLQLTYSTGYIRPTPQSKSKHLGAMQMKGSPITSGRSRHGRKITGRLGGSPIAAETLLEDVGSPSLPTALTSTRNGQQKALTPEAHIGIRSATSLVKTDVGGNQVSGNKETTHETLVLPVFRYYKVPMSRRKRSCQFASAFATGYALTAALAALSVMLIASAELSLSLNSLAMASPRAFASTSSPSNTGYEHARVHTSIRQPQPFQLSKHRLSSDLTWKHDNDGVLVATTPATLVLRTEANDLCNPGVTQHLTPYRYSSLVNAAWKAHDQVPALNILHLSREVAARKRWSHAVQCWLKKQVPGWIWKVTSFEGWRIPHPSLVHEFDRAAIKMVDHHHLHKSKVRYDETHAVRQSLSIVQIMSWITMCLACVVVLVRGFQASKRVASTSDTAEKLRALRDRKEIQVGAIASVLAGIAILVSVFYRLAPITSVLIANTLTSLVAARLYCTTYLWNVSDESIETQSGPRGKPQNKVEGVPTKAGATTPATKGASGPTHATTTTQTAERPASDLNATSVGSDGQQRPHQTGLRLSVASTSSSSSIINPQTPTATMYAGTPDGTASMISQPNLTTSQERYARHFGVLKPTEPRNEGEDLEYKDIEAKEVSAFGNGTGVSTTPLPYPKYVLTQRGEFFIAKLMEKFQRLMELADVECRPHEWKKEGTYEGIAVESHSGGPKVTTGNSALMCRGMGTVRVPPAKFMSLLWLTQHKNKYDEMCERVTTLEVVNNHVKIEEQEYKGYGVVSSRRMVLLAGWQRVDFGSSQYPDMELSDDVMLPSSSAPHAWRYGKNVTLHGLYDSQTPPRKGDPAKAKSGGKARNIADTAKAPNVPRNSLGYEYSADGYAMLAISLPDATYDRPATAPPIDSSLVEANLELGGFLIRGIKLPKVEKKGGLWGGGNAKPDAAAESVPDDQDFVWGSEVWGLGSIDLGGRIPNWIASQISRRQPLLVGRGEKYMMATKEDGKQDVLFNTIDVNYMYA